MRTSSTGIAAIAAERQRQIDEEGWDAAHDDSQNQNGELAGAGAAYAMSAATSLLSKGLTRLSHPLQLFRFDDEWWKPRSPREDLVRAGALIAAEIDRLDRAEQAEAIKDGD